MFFFYNKDKIRLPSAAIDIVYGAYGLLRASVFFPGNVSRRQTELRDAAQLASVLLDGINGSGEVDVCDNLHALYHVPRHRALQVFTGVARSFDSDATFTRGTEEEVGDDSDDSSSITDGKDEGQSAKVAWYPSNTGVLQALNSAFAGTKKLFGAARSV